MKIRVIQIALVLMFIFLNFAYLKYGEEFFDLFRLSGSNTVYEFQASSIDDSVEWLGRMCRDGKCLDHLDWRCGFDLGDVSDMRQCFIDTTHIAKSWVKLDDIRRYCGKKYASFTQRFGSEGECKDLGGLWGKIKYHPVIPQ